MTRSVPWGLIGQVLDRMGRGTAASSSVDQKIRFMNEMTMDEVRSLAQPKRPGWDRRIKRSCGTRGVAGTIDAPLKVHTQHGQ
jgi:hypothetical protein